MRTGLLLLAALAGAAAQAAAKDRPVNRVINLLRKMQGEMAAEGKKDDKIHADMMCWCKTNRKEKKAAISQAKRDIASMEGTVEESSGKAGEMHVRQKALESDIAEATDMLREKAAERRKDSENWAANRKANIQAAQMLKNAINILKKHNSMLIQARARAVIRHVVWNAGVSMKLNGEHATKLHSFLQGTPSNSGSYSSASGEIFGILGNMYDNMKADIAQNKADEDTAADNFSKLSRAKKNEIQKASDSLDIVKSERASNTELLQRTKQAHSDTQEQFDADTAFLADLELRCDDAQHQYDERVKLRGEEQAAVGEAIKILSDDDARETFNKSTNKDAVFLQIKNARREQAVSILKSVARKSGSFAVSMLAVNAQLDAFTKIKEEVDRLVADLKQQKKEEVKERDACNKSLFANGKATKKNNRQAEDLNSRIDDSKKTAADLNNEINQHKLAIAENNKQLKIAGENRNAENSEFQAVVANNNAAINVLKKAEARLKQFYDKHSAFVQQPAGFAEQNSNQGANVVLQLLANVIEESQTTIKDATAAEQEANQAYNEFVEETNKTNEGLSNAIDNKSDSVAQAQQEQVDAEQDLTSTMTDLESLANQAADIHGRCDFLLKNFETRQSGMGDEIEALGQAKQVLSGADFR